MTRALPLTAAVIVLLIGIGYFYQSAAFSSRSGDDSPLYSTRRHDPYGTAALADLLSERGIPIRTLEQPTLDDIGGGVMIQVLASPRFAGGEINGPQTHALADWIAQGNTVIQFTRDSNELIELFKLPVDTKTVSTDLQKIQIAEATGENPDRLPTPMLIGDLSPEFVRTHGLTNPRLTLHTPLTFTDTKDKNFTPLARLTGASQATVAGEYRVGRGRLIVVGAPTPVLNQSLAERGNLDFVLALIGHGPVIIDEWSHGIGHSKTVVQFLYELGLGPILLQVVFLAGLYVWSTSGHRWPETPTPNRARSSIEQIKTLGFLYSRSLTPDVAVERVTSEVRRRLGDALRASPSTLAQPIAALPPALRERAQAVLAQLKQIQGTPGTRCPNCKYDLRFNTTGACPECGRAIPTELRQHLAEASSETADADQRAARMNRAMADVLSESHALSQEIQNERRAIRRTA